MDGFLLSYDGFDPAAEGLRETLTSTGNGYLCTRGTAEWEEADGGRAQVEQLQGDDDRKNAEDSATERLARRGDK